MSTVRVLETNVLHASGVIYWLDGTSAAAQSDMRRVTVPLAVTFTVRPADLQVLHAPGRTALWRKPSLPIIAGIATEAQKTLPDEDPFELAGVVEDEAGRYNPRSFALTAGAGASHGLVLYPTPLGTRFGTSGGLAGTLRFAVGEAPVAFALLSLEVTVLGGSTLSFHAQSNVHGDFRLPLTRLPPLPESISSYAGQLRVSAPADAGPVDPGDLVAMRLGGIDSAAHAPGLNLNLVPGEVTPVRSFGKKFLSVQPN